MVLPDRPGKIALAMTDIAGAAERGLTMIPAAGLVAGRACRWPDRAPCRGVRCRLPAIRHFRRRARAHPVGDRADAGRGGHRRHARIAEPVGERVTGGQKSTSKSVISRRFVRQTETALVRADGPRPGREDIEVLMVDGEHLAERCVVIATDGTRSRSDCGRGSTENRTVVRSLLADLVRRGLSLRQWPAGRARRRQGPLGADAPALSGHRVQGAQRHRPGAVAAQLGQLAVASLRQISK